jgi:beta-lactamase regulating signal transducer with metallopeptidase domain
MEMVDRLNPMIEQVAQGPLGVGLMILWVAIAVLLAAREIVGHALLIRARRGWKKSPETLRRELHWPCDVPLLIQDHEWPCTVGFFRPIVLLPASVTKSLSPEALKQVARHELAHARWRDPLANAAVRMTRAVLWPSLPLWFLERIISAEREISADRAAIQESAVSDQGIAAVADYAATLVSVARSCADTKAARLCNTAATHMGTVGLEERIRRLFKFSEPLSRARVVVAGSILTFCTISITFLPVTSRGLDPQAQAEQRTLNVQHRLIGFANSPSAQRSTAAMNALIEVLNDRDWRVDREVNLALEQIRSSVTIEPFVITLLEDKDWRVREKVAWALGQLKDVRAVEPLIVALRDDSGEVKHTAAWALGVIGDQRATDALIANLKDSSFEARHGAAWALGRMHNGRAVQPLVALLQDRFADVRHGAAWSLGEIGDQRAIEPLRIALSDDDSDVRAQVKAALAKLSTRKM